MYSWRNFTDKFRRYGRPDKKEMKGLLITAVVFAFIISFRDWGTQEFSATAGIQNFFLSLFLVALVMLVHELGHRSVALWLGYRSQYKAWIPGLLASLVFTFLTNGHMPLLLPGGLIITVLTVHRIGWFAPEFNMKHAGWIAMSGPLACILFAVLLKPFATIPAFDRLMTLAILIAVFGMLPIPPMNGLRTFFGSRYIYVFIYASIISIGLLLSFVSGPLSLVLGIIIGILVLIVFFGQIDKRW